MTRTLLVLITACLLLSSCATFRATEYSSNSGNFNNFKKNYSFSVPQGYVLLEGEEKEIHHKLFSDFAPKDSDYFFNKKSQIFLLVFKGETFDIPMSANKKEVFGKALRAVRFELENGFRDHPYLKIESIKNINNFISINMTYNSGVTDTVIRQKISLYPVSKWSNTHAIFCLAMGIPQKNKIQGEADLKHIMDSLKLTAFDHSERVVK